MRRILIVGDSLSLTRHGDGLLYEHIYPVLAQRDLPQAIVVNGSLRGNCSEGVAGELYRTEYLLPLRPHHVVLQLGIVDCTPRLFRDWEKLGLAAMERVPLVRRAARGVINLASRHRLALTRTRRICRVESEDFERHLRSFAAAARDINAECAFTIVNIPRPHDDFVQRNFQLESIIDRYNAILARLVADFDGGVIDLHAFTARNPASLLPDGYHLRPEAHAFIHRELQRRLRALDPLLLAPT